MHHLIQSVGKHTCIGHECHHKLSSPCKSYECAHRLLIQPISCFSKWTTSINPSIKGLHVAPTIDCAYSYLTLLHDAHKWAPCPAMPSCQCTWLLVARVSIKSRLISTLVTIMCIVYRLSALGHFYPHHHGYFLQGFSPTKGAPRVPSWLCAMKKSTQTMCLPPR